MRMVINMSHDLYELDSNIIDNWIIENEEKIGDTYFIKTKNDYFSCHENFWDSYKIEKRNNRINQIIQK